MTVTLIGQSLQKFLNLPGRHLRIADGVRDVPVPEVVLDRPGVVAVVGELVAGRVPKHVRIDREGEARQGTCPGHQLSDGCRCHWPAALGDEQIRRTRVLPLQLA